MPSQEVKPVAQKDTSSPVPKVFALTLNWNGKAWLGDCLTSVLNMDYPNFEVVVIDNGSTDGSAQFIRDNFPNVHLVVNEENLGYSRGFNGGLEYAYAHGAEYFLIMNNDTVIDRQALTALVEVATSYERAGFVTGKVYFYGKSYVLQTIGKKEHPFLWSIYNIGAGERDRGQYDTIEERAFIDDVFILVSRQLYKEMGGYDPQFFLNCEEFDWQVRAKKKGWRCYYTPHAKLWHHGGLSMGGLGSPISEYFYVRNHILVMARHAGMGRFLRFYLWVAYHRVKSFMRGFVKGSPNMKSRWAGLLGLMAGTLWLCHRQQVNRVPFLVRMLMRSR